MSDVVTLQPQNASPLMRAVSLANAERRPIAPGQLGDMWDPWRCPEPALPYLAAAHGVAIWRADWSAERKRAVIARTIELKRRRGTIPCFEENIGFADAELVRAIVPPNIAVARESMTPEQRESWLAKFPELRVYYYARKVRLVGVSAPGPWLAAKWFVRDSGAGINGGRSAVVVAAGVERPAIVVAAVGDDPFRQELQVAVPSKGRRFVLGAASSGFMTPLASDASERLYHYRAAADGPDTLSPGRGVVDIKPKHVARTASGVAAFCAGQALGGPFRFAVDSTARTAVYDSFRLLDRDQVRAGKVRLRAGLTAGLTRLGHPAFHLELAVDMKFRRRKARRLPHLPGFVEEHDPTRVEEVLAGVRAAKLGRDKVEVQTGLYRPITAGDRVPLNGRFRLGQIIRSL